MRKRFDFQIGLGQPPIESVLIPLNSRDELPPIHDSLVRQIMGLPCTGSSKQLHHKTISDNVCHFDTELLEKINEIVVLHGRKALSGNDQAPRLAVKTDCFVLESDVHYPTDCNLLWDASRKCIELLSRLHEKRNLGGWRKNAYWKREVKNAKRACERIVSRGGPNKAERMLKAVQDYLEKSYALEKKVNESIILTKAQP